jgi:hypothetical protein
MAKRFNKGEKKALETEYLLLDEAIDEKNCLYKKKEIRNNRKRNDYLIRLLKM